MFGVGGARLTYLIAAAAGMFPAVAWPQDFPSKPVRYIVPFGPGGSPESCAKKAGNEIHAPVNDSTASGSAIQKPPR